MQRAGAPRHRAAGLVAAGGALALLTPPAVPLMLFALAAKVSMGALFLAALLPGLFLGLLFAVGAALEIGGHGQDRTAFAGWGHVGAVFAPSGDDDGD